MLSKKALEKLNIFSNEDLLHHYPSRYEDLTDAQTGIVVSSRNLYTRSGKTIQKVIVKTNIGNQELTWFNQPYLIKTLAPDVKISFHGQNYELITGGELIHTGRLVPVYPETKGVSSKALRRLIYNLLQTIKIEDWLPKEIIISNQLIALGPALKKIHFPKNQTEIDQATKRLAFDEMFLLQLAAAIRKKQWQNKPLNHQFNIDQEKILALIASLPFALTRSQNQVLKEILNDLSQNKPMNRLLQGEVGSGKTVISALAMYVSYLNGLQSCLMAPTEILANQHYQTLTTVFSHTGIKIGLVTKSVKTDGDILVGTQALLFKKIKESFGLIVIDEQHRFGVKQRAQLIEPLKSTPHLLTMTATPIPRTVAMTIYSDLDLSIIDEMPVGRQLVKTWVVPPEKRLDAYHWIAKQINKQHTQAFIVCPLIDLSLKETMKDIKAVTAEFEKLQTVFPQLKLGLLHGKIKTGLKNELISQFIKKDIDILVTTQIIEVGIDIPNATIMMIESADRFGLAQLHQLRGRVGRSNQQSYCLLFSENKKPLTLKRLQALTTTNSGLKLAELDLKLRGPGDLYGLKQHGFLDLKLASFTDADLIHKTKLAASTLKTLTLPLKKELEKHKIRTYAATA